MGGMKAASHSILCGRLHPSIKITALYITYSAYCSVKGSQSSLAVKLAVKFSWGTNQKGTEGGLVKGELHGGLQWRLQQAARRWTQILQLGCMAIGCAQTQWDITEAVITMKNIQKHELWSKCKKCMMCSRALGIKTVKLWKNQLTLSGAGLTVSETGWKSCCSDFWDQRLGLWWGTCCTSPLYYLHRPQFFTSLNFFGKLFCGTERKVHFYKGHSALGCWS